MTKLISHAKINLGLRILGRRREDGYHLLETIFQEIDFADEIIVHYKKQTGPSSALFRAPVKQNNFAGNRFTLVCDHPDIPCDEKNLIIKAAHAMEAYLPDDLSAHFELKKRIPIAAGLGGGSSNAASILKWLNVTAKLSQEKLKKIAVELGADVPFFLQGGTAYAEGIGDILTPLEIPKNWWAVLVFPEFAVSTLWAYEQLKFSLTDKLKKAKIPSQLEKGFNWQIFENDFDKAIIPSYPEIGKIKTRLYSLGAKYAGLSGSGSTVFGICESCETAKRVVAAFNNAVITRPI